MPRSCRSTPLQRLSCGRGSGLGTCLLAACLAWTAARGLRGVHVDFESANPVGRAFWRRHFQPVLHSVRRRVHQDIQQPGP
ncbi:MAG: hypothetical protein AB1505_09585 [Candidatus Latescibacterota bacterium]